MMKTKSSLLQFVVGLGTVTALMSCSKDMYDTSYGDVQKQTYATNFVAKYGPIAPSQTWDFTTGEQQLATRGYTAINAEIMEKGISFGDMSKLKTELVKFNGHPEWDYYAIKGGVEKNGELLETISKVLPEKKVWTGLPAVLVAPASSFYIYPLFSGGNIRFDLNVKVGNNDPITVFKKDYTNFQTINGMQKANGEIVNMKGIKIEAPVGTPVEVYLDNLIDLGGKAIKGTMGTTNGKAVYVDIPEGIVPELEDVVLKENSVVKYIGIEDAASGSDNDYNDVVLAVVGNSDVPQEKIITNDQYEVKICRAKRYLIEDLGATDDFDFNDVVVDVEENTVITHQVTYENGVLKSDNIMNETSEPTKAVIRAMGGTIDFELVVGNTSWSKSGAGFDVKTMYNTQGSVDYNKVLAEFEVTGWNRQANNVSIKVNGKDGKVYDVTFPKAGEAPMIIAVDPTQNWMNERVSVPATWFYYLP
jgi:hypothetical protein